METVRVHITYRPLRICWAIAHGDAGAFRQAVTSNHALWGGRFNPIVIADQEAEARTTIESFRADLVVPLGAAVQVSEFAASYGHLAWPFFHPGVFSGPPGERGGPVLDVGAAIECSRNSPGWTRLQRHKARLYRWAPDDPLSDVLLMQLGAYPDPEITGTDFERMFKDALGARECRLDPDRPLPPDLLDHPCISYLARHNVHERFNRFPPHLNGEGIYLGDASDLEDLVVFWNLRAANLGLLFVDRQARSRYAGLLPAWTKAYSRARRGGHRLPVWSRAPASAHARVDPAEILGGAAYQACRAPGPDSRHGRIPAPTMHVGATDTLGVLITERERVKLTFTLPERPYVSAHPLYAQHLVASLRMSGAPSERGDVVLDPPYLPELNPFYAREMNLFPHRLRSEPYGVGLIVDAAATDAYLYALPSSELFDRVFCQAGFAARVSSAGLVARRLIAQLGGLQGGRVFKIPGTRTLLKAHGPTASFSKRSALQLIAKNADHPEMKFPDYAGLRLEPRCDSEPLTPASVFAYLVRQGLFRIGHDLTCPHCQLQSWFAVDDLRQRPHCRRCGARFDASAQLVGGEWAYRRSGILGAERNAQGAIPVVLTMQQLDTTLRGPLGRDPLFSVSLDLLPRQGRPGRPCTVDFALLLPLDDLGKTAVVIGACKDGGDGATIDGGAIDKLRSVADAFPRDRFVVFIVLAKLGAFTPSEIALAGSLNTPGQARVIMLTERELEPDSVFERTCKRFDIPEHAVCLDDLAAATVSIYFDPQPAASPQGTRSP